MNEILTIAFSADSIFDHKLFFRARNKGELALSKYANKNLAMKQGPCFDLALKLSQLRHPETQDKLVHVIILAPYNAKYSKRFFYSLEQSAIEPGAICFTEESPAPYLMAYQPHLFLSTNESHIRSSISCNIPSAHVYPEIHSVKTNQIRIAFDGDCVLFTDESERVFTSCPTNGLQKFFEYEIENSNKPMEKGPLYPFLIAINQIQQLFATEKPFHISLVTARSFPTHNRPLHTFKKWGVDVDEVFFMNGRNKAPILNAFNPHMFFDDQSKHCTAANHFVPAAQVFNSTTEHNQGT